MSITSVIIPFLAWHVLFPRCALADLPIHALTGDVIGHWRLFQTSQWSQDFQLCGGSIPNSNLDNLKIKDYKSYLSDKFGNLSETLVILSDERLHKRNEIPPRNQWQFLAVKDGKADTSIGNWTMVYDEGIEIQIGEVSYFGFIKYESIQGDDCPRVLDSAQEDENGDTPCYSTDPSKIRIGWMSKKVIKGGKTSHIWGCFYAEKLQQAAKRSYVLDQSFKLHPPDLHIPEIPNKREGTFLWKSKAYPQFTGLSPLRFLQLHKGSAFKSIHHSLSSQNGESRFLQTANYSVYACPRVKSDLNPGQYTLPREWTWGDGFNDESQQLQPYSQGQCGSCYAMSTLYVLAKRFQLLVKKLYPHADLSSLDFELSVQSIVSCSPFAQGCYGGFPFLVGRHLVEFGVVSDKEFPYKMNIESQPPECPEKASTSLWFASDYGYVGGCYECTSEFEIMKEIYHHGPVVVAMDAPDTLFSYSDGIFDDVQGKHGYVCDMPQSGLNGWEYTNHAMILVGWGEETTPSGSEIRYWIVKNTWGKNWGVDGFFKVRRGVNLGGIESQAVYIDPDLSRGMGFEITSKIRKPNDF